MRRTILLLLTLCFCLELFSLPAIVAQQKPSPPIKIKQPIPLPDGGNLIIDTVRLEGDHWEKGTICFKLLFSRKDADTAASESDFYGENLSFALDDVKLLLGEKSVFLNSIAMGRPGGGVDFVLDAGQMRSLGIGVYGNKAAHKGMVYITEDHEHFRFIGTVTGPVYIYFVAPEVNQAAPSPARTGPSRTLYLKFVLKESALTANVKIN